MATTTQAVPDSTSFDRKLTCPFCCYSFRSDGIGAVYCGPHKVGDEYFPAVRMQSVFDQDAGDSTFGMPNATIKGMPSC